MADFCQRGVLGLHQFLCELHIETNDGRVNLGFISQPTIMHQSKSSQGCV